MTGEIVYFVRGGRGGKRAGAGRPKGAKTRYRTPRRPKRIENKKPFGFVYIMQEVGEPGVCKIGISEDPKTRLSGHQVSNWRKLRMASVFDCKCQALSERVERAILAAFRPHVISGEWIRQPADVVAAAVKKFCEQNGIRLDRPEVTVVRAVG